MLGWHRPDYPASSLLFGMRRARQTSYSVARLRESASTRASRPGQIYCSWTSTNSRASNGAVRLEWSRGRRLIQQSQNALPVLRSARAGSSALHSSSSGSALASSLRSSAISTIFVASGIALIPTRLNL